MRVEEYIRPDHSNPYRRWFDSLNVQAAAKVAVANFRLSRGNTSSVKWIDGIGEYRIDWGPGHRIYLARDGADLIILYWRWNQEATGAGHRNRQAPARGVPGSEDSGEGSCEEGDCKQGTAADAASQEKASYGFDT